jgi:glycerophosphoryl diester phosphodiesterase
MVIAHRGASAAYPENTLAAFTGARELGADAVELDARRTADGQVIVHHDAQLPDGRVIVDLAAVELPSHVPSLAEALDACAGMVVNIEIKNWPDDPDFDDTERVAAQVVELVGATGWRDQVLVSCFHLPTVDRVRSLDAGLATAFLHIRIDGPTALAQAVEHGHGALHPWDPHVSADLVVRAHAQGVKVNVWTVDDPDRMLELAAWDVDGIVTNVPDLARETLGPR